jgi:hypothetical protein
LRLLLKTCKAHNTIPTSYVLQRELVSVGEVRYRGGFGDVSNGEYLGRPVAIKRLRMKEEDSDRSFKVTLTNLIHHCYSPLPAVVSGDYLLETFVPPEYLTFPGSFCFAGPMWFQHHRRVDAKRECDAVCALQPKSKPFAIGESTCCFLLSSLVHL